MWNLLKNIYLETFTVSIWVMLFSYSAAATDYTVRLGDTLSEIVSRTSSPPPPLYGTGGRLEMILKLNPHIVDPDQLEVGDHLKLYSESLPLTSWPKSLLSSFLSYSKHLRWSFEYTLGGYLHYYSQKKGLGEVTSYKSGPQLANLIIMANSTDHKITFSTSFYRESSNSSNLLEQENNFFNYQLKITYPHFSLSLWRADINLYKFANNSALIQKTSPLFIVGGREWKVPKLLRGQTISQLSLEGGLPIWTTAGNTDIEVHSTSGLYIGVKYTFALALNRYLSSLKNIDFIAHTKGEFYYLQQNLTWNQVSADTSSTLLRVSIDGGVRYSF
jgi:hypothetical protein